MAFTKGPMYEYTPAAGTNATGPSWGIGSTFQKNNGPKRSNRQRLLVMQWAHPRASQYLLKKIIGPTRFFGSSW
jgi:hypothetical protein